MNDATILTLLTAIFAAIGVMWRKIETLSKENRDQAKEFTKVQKRLTRLLSRLTVCPGVSCPFKSWSQEELDDDDEPPTQTLSRPAQDTVHIHQNNPSPA